VLKLGFYANEQTRQLNVMCEVFQDSELEMYQERFGSILPEYMKDPVDYYTSHGIQPEVIKYNVDIYSILNDVAIDQSPILFEEGDDL